MTISININNTVSYAWDSYVVRHNLGGPYLTMAWKKAVETAYDHKVFYLSAYKINAIVGVLPLVLIKSPLLSKKLVSLPFGDYGGILADSNEVAKVLLASSIDLSRNMKSGLEIRCTETSSVIENTNSFYNVTTKCRMYLALPNNSKELWTSFKSKLRSQVRRAEKEGLIVRLGHRELIKDFYQVFSQNMRDIGSPVHSLQWFAAIMSAFSNNAKVGVIYKENRPIGAGIILLHSDTASIPWASTCKEFNHISPNMLLYWSFLKYATDAGYRYVDFGRSTPGEGTFAFKKQWGAIHQPLTWYVWYEKNDYKNLTKKSGKMQYHLEKLWQCLPLSLANKVGPHLRKYIDR